MTLDCVIYCAFYSILFRGAVFFRTRCTLNLVFVVNDFGSNCYNFGPRYISLFILSFAYALGWTECLKVIAIFRSKVRSCIKFLICHKPEQLGLAIAALHHSSSCLELTATSPSLPVHQSQSVSSRTQDSSFQTAWPFTDFSSENY